MKKDIIIISGQSGAGKGTLIGRLMEKHPETFHYVKTTTTRPPRKTSDEAKQDRERYNFVSRKEFESKLDNGEMAEWARVYGNLYGKSKSEFQKAFDADKLALVEIDVQGAATVKKAFGDRVKSIFIEVPSVEELEKRLRLRNSDSGDAIKTRLNTAERELVHVKEFDHSVVNDEIPRAVTELEEIIFGNTKQDSNLKS